MKKIMAFLMAMALMISISFSALAICEPGVCYLGDWGPFLGNEVDYVWNGDRFVSIWRGSC